MTTRREANSSRSWLEAGLFLKSDYVQGTTVQFTDDHRRELRRANINEVLIEVDGAFYASAGLGLTAAGGSGAADHRAMAYMENLRRLRKNLDNHLSAVSRELDQAAGHKITGDWKPHVHADHIGLERGDDAFIGIPWLDVD